MKPSTHLEALRLLSQTKPLFRRAEAIAVGVNAMALTRLERAGVIMRTGRDLYYLREGEGTSCPA